MPDDAPDIRALLGVEASNAPPPGGMSPRNLRRARVRRATVIAASLAAIVVVGAVFAFGATWVLGEDFGHTGPIDPVPTPKVTDTNGQITFSRFAKDGGIMVMNADGSAIRSVVSQGHYALDKPAWAPSGFKIAFHGFFGAAKNEGGGLFLIDPDGTDRSFMFLGGDAPAWSLDSTYIAYTQLGRIHIVSMGRNPRPETLDVEGDYPSWSPDGQKLVFSRGGGGLWTVNRDGSDLRLLLEAAPDNRPIDPDWSPDGSQIAFTSYADDGTGETIEIIAVDGSGRRAITEGSSPAWSPDGTRISFERSDVVNTSHIYSIRVDGTDLRQLTFGSLADHSPDWISDN